jgi:hypothetical protein
MVRGHDQPWWIDSCPASCGPASSPAAAPTAAPRGGVARQVPDRNGVAALLVMARTSPLEPAARQGAGLRQRDHLLAPPGRGARAGVFEQLQAVLLDELGGPAASSWSGPWSTPPASARSKGR